MKTLICLAGCLFSGTLFTQPVLTNYSVTDSAKRVVYAGVDNRLVLTGASKTQGLHMRSGQHVITHHPDSANVFHVICYRPLGKGDTLSVFSNDSLILKQFFRFKYMPVPEVRLSGLKDTATAVETILKNPVLEVVHPGCIYKLPMYVLRYEMELITDQKGITTEFKTGRVDRLPDEQIRSIQQLQPGDKIIFSYFLATCNFCPRPSKLRPMTITIGQ